MDAVIRACAVYAALLIVFRISGRRTLSEITTFDLILLLIVGEATQQALLGLDNSFTNAFLVIMTLVFVDIVISYAKSRSDYVQKLLEGVPTVIVENGRPLEQRMRTARVSVDDVMEAARRLRGIERLDQIRYAVLEVNGGISVVPYEQPETPNAPS